MIPGVTPRLEIGPDEDLNVGREDEFPIAINQWRIAAEQLLKARGAVVAKPERATPLWLVLHNKANRQLPVAWVYYRLTLKTGLSDDSYVISGDLTLEDIPAGGQRRIALLDLDTWYSLRAEVTAVSATPLKEYPREGTEPEVALAYVVGTRDLRVVVYCPTAVAFTVPSQVVFNLPQDKAKVRFRHPSARETLCVTRHHGLPGLIAVIDMPLRAGDLLGHAFQGAAICDGIVSTAFALTLADMRESFPVLACESSPGLVDRPFIHFFADHLVMGRRAQLDAAQWTEKASDMVKNSSKRVVRAIRWLRKMHTEDDLLDRFLAGWTGLETLNPELCDYFKVPKSVDEEITCGNCKEKTVRRIPRATGLKELFVTEGKKDVYDACSQARNGLLHGFKEIGELAGIARKHSSDIGLMLARAIQVLSSIPVPTDPEKFKWLNGYRVASLVFLEGTMKSGELDAYEASHNELPLFEFDIRHGGGVVDGKTVLEGQSNIKAPPDCSFSSKRMGISGPVTITDVQVK